MKSKKKYIILVIGIITLGLLFTAGTYAYLTFTANVTNATYNGTTTCFIVNYDITNENGTSDITGTMFPSSTPKGGLSGNVSVGMDSSCGVSAVANIDLNVTNASAILTQTVGAHCEDSRTLQTLSEYTTSSTCTASDNGVWVTNGTALKYAIYNNINHPPVNVGYITGNGVINLHNNILLATSQRQYYIYVWLDGELSDNSYTSLTFNGHVSADVIQDERAFHEEPELDSGMIPVIISDDGTATTVYEDSTSWYNYDDKQWANIVLVDNDSRSTYVGTSGVQVLDEDILAYYVWIPRYKYQIWTTTISAVGKEQSVNISFEREEEDMVLGTTIGSYRTHPAFWWDDNSNGTVDSGETIAGVWVAKFEASTLSTSECYSATDDILDICNNADFTVKIISNVSSLRGQDIRNAFLMSRKFSSSGNMYGLNNLNTNAHLIKSSEWGAVAYLSHSRYGLNGNIRVNNSMLSLTGCGAASFDDGYSSTCSVTYGQATSYPQSTTGNISGIFDMSGSAYERCMGNYNDSLGDSGFTEMPDAKYYNKYTVADLSTCTVEECGGHALDETQNWYGDEYYYFTETNVWVGRSGYWDSSTSAGLFKFSATPGGNVSYATGFRPTIVVGFGD